MPFRPVHIFALAAWVALWTLAGCEQVEFNDPTQAPKPAATSSSTAAPAATAQPTPLPLRQAAKGVYANKTPLKFKLEDEVPQPLRELWDGAEHNVIYITNTAWGPNMMFDLHLCEEFVVDAPGWPEKHFLNNRRIDADLWQWREEPDGWHFELDQKEVLNIRIAGRVRASGDQQVTAEGTILNRMGHGWGDDMALMCLRTRNAEPFVDTSGRNIFLKETTGTLQEVNVRDLLGTDFDEKIKETSFYTAWVSKPGMTHYSPAIRKVDREGKRQIRFQTNPPIALGGNRQPGMNCIHSNIALNGEPGTTVTFRSVIDFSELK